MRLFAAEALRGETFKIGIPSALTVLAQFAKIAPGEEPGVVAVIEDDAYRVMADRLHRPDFNIALAGHKCPLLRRVALNFRAGRFNPQIFRRELKTDRKSVV